MHAIYYDRKRDTGYDRKSMLEGVFVFLGKAAEKNFAVKTLYFTKEEIKALETEITELAADVNFYKLKDPAIGIAKIIGTPYEVLDTVSLLHQRKVDKRG